MKDITVSANRLKKEFKILLVCIAIGFLVNVIAILSYKSEFSELFTSLHYVVLFGFFIYGVWTILRLIVYTLKKLVSNKKAN